MDHIGLCLLGSYKQILDHEKKSNDDKRRQEKALIDSLTAEVQSWKQAHEQAVNNYEMQLKQLDDEKRTRYKENIDNLQTLVKELTYIEEKNEELNAEMEQHKKSWEEERQAHKKTKEELLVSKQLIQQLEIKITRQEKDFQQQQQQQQQQQTLTEGAGETSKEVTPVTLAPLQGESQEGIARSDDSLTVQELRVLLQKERQKVEAISRLLAQMRMVILPDAAKVTT